jgi:hypothetical protein
MGEDPQLPDVILWQSLSAKDTSLNVAKSPPTQTFTLPDTIAELLGVYKVLDERNFTPPTAMAVIGAKYPSSSAVDTSQVDGRRLH